ncbi:MAG: hypothetical protein E7028_08860 [Planctomycetaceae bacterium]|nr:hypothetical protein [Planctomycetaceae bacterium]MBQ2820621.1 hypothetical protein [Thermoguttaceae bacterium]MDO4425550.1 hypothetical protein [Planctomycetia bacterium]
MQNSSQDAMFSQIDVSSIVAPAKVDQNFREEQKHTELVTVLRELLAQQKKQNELLVQLINIQTAAQRQRMRDLQAWRNAHPELSRNCRELLDKMSEMQTEYFTRMVENSVESGEDWGYSEFMFNDFVDRFGPRLVHLNALLQALSHLAAPAEKP